MDSSTEPFKWGLPDLDALRDFLHQQLGWNQSKSTELLLPIVQRMTKRGTDSNANKQSTLNSFMGIGEGTSYYRGGAPRNGHVYESKRLQEIVTDYRKKRKAHMTANIAESDDDKTNELPLQRKPRKRKASAKSVKQSSQTKGDKKSKAWLSNEAVNTSTEEADGRDRDGVDELYKNVVPLSDTQPEPPTLRPRPKPKLRARSPADSETDP